MKYCGFILKGEPTLAVALTKSAVVYSMCVKFGASPSPLWFWPGIHKVRTGPGAWSWRVSLPYQWAAPATRSVVSTQLLS